MKRVFLMALLSLGCLATALVAQNKPRQELFAKASKIAGEIIMIEAKANDPVSVNASLVLSEQRDQFAVIIKASLMNTWSIYAFVPEDQPYIETKMEVRMPDGVKPLGDWVLPKSTTYEDDILIYTGELVFTRYYQTNMVLTDQDTIQAGLFYQACDSHMCFPPKRKVVNLVFE